MDVIRSESYVMKSIIAVKHCPHFNDSSIKYVMSLHDLRVFPCTTFTSVHADQYQFENRHVTSVLSDWKSDVDRMHL